MYKEVYIILKNFGNLKEKKLLNIALFFLLY